MNHRKLVNLTSTNEKCARLAIEKGLYLEHTRCSECDFETSIQKRKNSLDGYCFSCPKCLTRFSIITNTFLHWSKVKLSSFFDLVYFFLNDYQKLKSLVNKTNLCKSTIIKFRNLFRNAILEYLM